jgi:hypothetical protein
MNSNVIEYPQDTLATALAAFQEGADSFVVRTTDRKHVTMRLPDADLHIECEMVFRDGDNFYMAIYHRMSDYYMSQVGDNCDPFTAYKGSNIPCTQVYPHTTIEYRTTPPDGVRP